MSANKMKSIVEISVSALKTILLQINFELIDDKDYEWSGEGGNEA